MTFRRLFAATLGTGVLLAATSVHAQDSEVVLTTAVPFLQIEPDSRAAGMGNAGVAIADNAYAVFWNPAGLGRQEGTEVSFTHAPWLPALGADLSYEYLAAKHNIGRAGTVGAHLTYFNLGEQIRTNASGEELGTFRSYELAAGLSYGVEVTDGLMVGAGGRFVYSSLTGNSTVDGSGTFPGKTFGFDLGAIYEAPTLPLGAGATPSVGFSLANVGPGISYTDNNSDAIPTTFRLGGALDTQLDQYNRINLAVDVNKVLVSRDSSGNYDSPLTAIFSSWGAREINTRPTDGTCQEFAEDTDPSNDGNCERLGALQQLTLGAGLEYWYNDLLALRTGYFYEDPNNGNRQFITFGAGIRYSLVGVDLSYVYALQENAPTANQLRFTLLLQIPR